MTTPDPKALVEARLSEAQIRQWIDACNSEEARNTLRHYLLLAAPAPPPKDDPSPCGSIDCVNGCDGAPDLCMAALKRLEPPKDGPALDREGLARITERIDRELTEMRGERFMPPWGMVGIDLLWVELKNALAAGEG